MSEIFLNRLRVVLYAGFLRGIDGFSIILMSLLMRMFGECTEAYTPVVKINSGIEVNFMTLPNLVFVFNRGLGFPL